MIVLLRIKKDNSYFVTDMKRSKSYRSRGDMTVEDRKFSIRTWVRFWWALPILWVSFLHYQFAKGSSNGWYFPPIFLMYALFISIYLFMVGQSIILKSDRVLLRKKMITREIYYKDLKAFTITKWGKQGTLFHFTYEKNGKTKRRRYPLFAYGEEQVQLMINELKSRHRFIEVEDTRKNRLK